MRDAKLLETTDLPIADIDVADRLRPVSDMAVTSLIESIEAIGLQAEIHVRRVRHQDNKLVLIAGGHRIAAFARMGRTTIPAKVWDCDDNHAALAEIDDNLAHAELDTLELAVFLAERKRVYERIYPETARGTAGAINRWNATDNMSVASFAAATAAKSGQSERTIYRLLAAGQRLNREAVTALRSAPKKVSLADLQILAKCGDPADRDLIIAALNQGAAKSAKAALRAAHAQPGDTAISDGDKKLTKLNDAFARAPQYARRHFVEAHAAALRELLDDLPENSSDVVVFAPRREA